jgi:AcrR family transcriptional regulator
MERVLTAKGTATRGRIVEGAAQLIRESGVANVSLDDIRAVTSTSKSQLFHYFPDGKADLLLAVARHEADQVLQDQQPMLANLTTWAAWRAWQQRVIAKYAAQGRRCPLAALTAQLGMADPATEEIVTNLYDRWYDYLHAGITALRDAGQIHPDTDTDKAARAVLTAITGGTSMLMATERINYLEDALDQALNALQRR